MNGELYIFVAFISIQVINCLLTLKEKYNKLLNIIVIIAQMVWMTMK